jgi:hypothetical protein
VKSKNIQKKQLPAESRICSIYLENFIVEQFPRRVKIMKKMYKIICVFMLVFLTLSMTGAACEWLKACNDKFTVYQDGMCFNVLQNDKGHGLEVTTTGCITTEQGGTVQMMSNGNFIYTKPCSDFEGRDSFIYAVVDKFGNCDTAKVTLKVK